MNDYNKRLVIFDKLYVKSSSYLHNVALECQELELSFSEPQASAHSSILWPIVNVVLAL